MNIYYRSRREEKKKETKKRKPPNGTTMRVPLTIGDAMDQILLYNRAQSRKLARGFINSYRARHHTSTNESISQEVLNSLSYSEYGYLCRLYTGVDYERKIDDYFEKPMADKKTKMDLCSNPAHPIHPFHIRRSLLLAQKLNADPIFCNPRNYMGTYTVGEGYQYTFPDPTRVWRIPTDQCAPDTFLRCMFPDRQPRHRSMPGMNIQRYPILTMFEANRSDILPDDWDDQRDFLFSDWERDINALTSTEEMIASFENCFNTNINGITHRQLMIRLDADYQELYKKHFFSSSTRLEWRKKYTEFQKNGLTDFEMIWNRDANIPIALKAIFLWGEEYLSKHKTFYIPEVPQFKNLSFMGNLLSSIMDEFEGPLQVNCIHTLLLKGLLAAMHTYRWSKSHPHLLIYGRHATSKSYFLEMIQLLLISLTVILYMHASNMALGTSGHEYSYTCFVCEEAPNAMLGLEKDGMGSSSSSSSYHKTNNATSSDAANQTKNRLTQNSFTSIRSTVNATSGSLETQRMEMELNNTYIVCTNEQIMQKMSAVMISRYSPTLSPELRRDDKSMITANAMSTNPEFARMIELVVIRWRRTQYLMCMAQMLQDSKLLPSIDTRLAALLCDQIFDLAAKKGCVETDRTRSLNRVKYLLERTLFIT